MAWRGIATAFRRVEPASPQIECLCDEPENDDEDDAKTAIDPTAVELRRQRVTVDTLEELAANPVRRLTLMNCQFSNPLSSAAFCAMALDYLEIYSPGDFVMADRLEALSRMPSLRTLVLVRTDFLNKEAAHCYNALGRMTQLEHLVLDRTITIEKAPGRSFERKISETQTIRQVTDLDPAVMEALATLLERGNLKTLSLQWCTALGADDIARLQRIRPTCTITWAPSVHASARASSSTQASTKAHDD